MGYRESFYQEDAHLQNCTPRNTQPAAGYSDVPRTAYTLSPVNQPSIQSHSILRSPNHGIWIVDATRASSEIGK